MRTMWQVSTTDDSMSNSSSNERIKHLKSLGFMTLSQLLEGALQLEPSRVVELFRLGSIFVNKVRVFENCEIAPDDYIRAHILPRRYPVNDVVWQNRIEFENENFIIVDKPSGVPVHPTLDNATENVAAQMSILKGQKVFVTQRLDVGTEGIFLLAKTPEYQAHYNRQLQLGQIEKFYRALVSVPVVPQKYVHFMEPGDRAPRRVRTEDGGNWARCEMIINDCKPSLTHEGCFQLEIELLTGRTHQIRAQLQEIGAPIVGDSLYVGIGKEVLDRYLAQIHSTTEKFSLACVRIGFQDRVTRELHSFELSRKPFQ